MKEKKNKRTLTHTNKQEQQIAKLITESCARCRKLSIELVLPKTLQPFNMVYFIVCRFVCSMSIYGFFVMVLCVSCFFSSSSSLIYFAFTVSLFALIPLIYGMDRVYNVIYQIIHKSDVMRVNGILPI